MLFECFGIGGFHNFLVVDEEEGVVTFLEEDELVQKWVFDETILLVDLGEYFYVLFANGAQTGLSGDFKILEYLDDIFRNEQIDPP